MFLDYLQNFCKGSTLYGFRGGPAGIMKCKYVVLTPEYIYPYRNQVKILENFFSGKLELSVVVLVTIRLAQCILFECSSIALGSLPRELCEGSRCAIYRGRFYVSAKLVAVHIDGY